MFTSSGINFRSWENTIVTLYCYGLYIGYCYRVYIIIGFIFIIGFVDELALFNCQRSQLWTIFPVTLCSKYDDTVFSEINTDSCLFQIFQCSNIKLASSQRYWGLDIAAIPWYRDHIRTCMVFNHLNIELVETDRSSAAGLIFLCIMDCFFSFSLTYSMPNSGCWVG